MTDITIRAADGGSFTAYQATPKSGRGPGVLLIQEIFGVNKVMRDIADGLAAQGYVVLCPDLFWRQQPGIQITDKTEAEWARAFELYKGFNEAKGVEDLKSTLAHLRKLPACTGRFESVLSVPAMRISRRRASCVRCCAKAMPSKSRKFDQAPALDRGQEV